ncbi:MuF-C-terminal domain-containing protein [Faecalibacterium duncaniae]
MAWKSGSAAALRNRNEKERQEKTGMATAAGGAEPLSQRKSADSRNPLALGSTGTSWAKGSAAALRAQKQQEATSRQTGTDLYSTALEDYRTRNNLGFADAMDSRSDELNRQKVTASPAEKMEQNASTVQMLREQRNNGIRMDVYSTVNNWKDASERNRELARLVTEPTLPRGAVSAADLPAGVDYLAADTGGMGIMPVLENTRYIDSDLKKMGYTQDEINRARLYMKAYNDLSLGERAGRRVESDLEGKKENIKGMIGQYAGALSPALTASAEEQMIRRVQSGRYTDEQLEAAGYDPELIRTAHERIRSGELYDKADDDSNRLKGLYEWGQDAHKAGENLTADAMAGESNVGRFFHRATSSAAENLIVSAINPALVLPVLSAHGAGDSMAASDEAGESPEKAILKATAKFGAGWAINSVGVADLAKTMGSDYAKDTVAGTIADWVRRQVGNQAFREAYPAIANAISGGADNAMQAFVETYADKAIDAALGDSKAAQTMFTTDTLVQALEAGLSGGASGALGGAVGKGLSRMNAGDSSLRGNVERYAAQDEYEQALKDYQRREELAREPGDGEEPLSQRSGADSSPTEGSPWQDGQDGQGVLTAIKNDGREVFYDVVNIEPTKIKASDGTAEGNTSGSKSTETIGEAGESDAENADSNGKRHPTSPESIIQNTEAGVNDTAVENPGENVDYSDVETRIDPTELDGTAWNRDEQKQTARQLAANARMTTKAAQGVVDAMPEGIGAGIYARAANSLYQLGKMEDVTSFEQAVNLTGPASTTGGAVRQVLALGQAGENALRIAYTYGRGEAEAYNARKAAEIGSGKGAVNPDAGTYFKGRNVSKGTDAMDAFIELGAKSSGTAIHRAAEGLKNNAKGLIRAAAGEMYLSGEAGSETVMHETFHLLNEWSPETGQAVMDRMLKYLVQQNGMESTEKLVESYLARYEDSGVKMTWNQALEEITADAMETVFGTEDGFRNFVRQQAAEAKMNSEARGVIGKVMNRIDELLHNILADVQRFLKKEPTNAAARAAKNLTEAQLRDLQSLYFEHQAEASAKYREALEAKQDRTTKTENAPSRTEEAGVKYSIDEGFEQAIDELDNKTSDSMITVGKTSEVLKSIGVNDQIILWNAGKIRKILAKHSDGMNRTIIKQVPQVLEEPVIVLHSDENAGIQQGKDYGGRIYMFGEVYDAAGKPVSVSLELLPTRKNGLVMDNIVITSAYGKNSIQNALNRDQILYVDPNQKRTAAWLGSTGLQLPVPPTMYGSMGKITYLGNSVKMIQPNSRNARLAEFLTRDADGKYQLDVDSESVDAARTEGLGDVEQQNKLVGRVMDLAGKVTVSDTGLKNIARAVLSDCDSRMDAKTLTERLLALSDYIRQNQTVDWAEANAFVMDMADQIMQKSAKRNDELWKAYPELHRMGMTIEKGSKDYREVLYKWGSWANAKKELARHGVDIRQSNEGEHSRWDADFTELQKLGAGLLPTETPSSAADALEAMAAAHDAIRPVMENSYNENWEEAQQDIAMQIWQRYMESPEIASEENAALRKEFAEKRQEVRDIAKQQAAEAKAKAEIARVRAEQAEKDALVEPYRQITAKAMERKEVAERFARKQKESVAATVQRAKDNAAKRVEKARKAREMDNTRRVVNQLTNQLTQMCETPNEKKYVPEYLLDKVRPVVMLANDAIGNHEAAKKIAAGMGDAYGPIPEGTNIRDAVDGLSRGIAREMKLGERAAAEWQQSGIMDQIDNWMEDVNENRQIEMEKLRSEIENANKWLKEETLEKKAYIARLNSDLKAYQDGNMAKLTTDQLRGLRDILEKTMYIVKNENVMLGSMEDVMIDDFAEDAAKELEEVGKKQGDGMAQKVLRELGSVYRMNTMNIERNFERMGNYHHGGAMEQLGQMLNDGQFRKERITAEGEKIFDNVTGPEHAEELHRFTHDLVDIGLKTQDGKPWPVTRNVAAELWVQLQNEQGMHHLLHGGATIADLRFSTKGMAGLGDQFSETVTLGELVTTDGDGNKLNAYEISQRESSLRTSLLGEIENVLTDYDWLWINDFRELGKLTKQYINETSMTLYHTKQARVNNYIRLHVDKNTLAEQNEGVKTDRSVGSEGFMKNRQNSSKPLELVGLVKQAAENIENTAQFAGMAVPLRNAEKVLNSMQGGKTLYGQIERVWGRAGRNYMTKAMADLTGTKSGGEVFDHLSSVLRGNAAAAVLTGNLNVTLLQAASLPTAAAELGWNAVGQSAIQFVKNASGKERKAVEQRAYRFGDTLLPTRMRGSRRGELSTAAKDQGVFSTLHDAARNSGNKALRGVTRAVDAVADKAAGSIGWMDEVTVAALFHGSEQYVQKNLAEYDLTEADLPTKTQEDGSKAYQNAVVSKFQRVVERTQPNYTAMQRTGIQRSKNQMLKTISMFSTQRQQNAQIVVSAVEDLAAQAERYWTDGSAENKAELKKALQRTMDMASSQIVQTAVIAGLGLAVKFVLHKWGDLQDENGDMTLWSVGSNFLYQFLNSGVSNYTGGSELWTAGETILSGKSFGSYDSISMTGFSAVNDVVKTISKLNGLLDKDTGEMTEKELDDYADSVKWAWADTAGQLMMLVGVPYNNGKKYVQAVFGWMDSIKEWGETGDVNFSSLPASATGQYDRLYNAIQSGDSEEAAAALGKLEGMKKTDQIASQLKRRLKQYDEDIQAAAEYQNDGKESNAGEAKNRVLERMCTAYGVRLVNDPKKTPADDAQRDAFVDIINGAVNEKADSLLAGDKDRTVYSDLTDALETGKRKDVQDEIDRLRTAGKDDGSIKRKITDAVKEEYLAGNDRDREKLEQLLLKLEKADGSQMYEEKDFAQWVKDAAKKEEQAKNSKDEWAGVR